MQLGKEETDAKIFMKKIKNSLLVPLLVIE